MNVPQPSVWRWLLLHTLDTVLFLVLFVMAWAAAAGTAFMLVLYAEGDLGVIDERVALAVTLPWFLAFAAVTPLITSGLRAWLDLPARIGPEADRP